MARGRLFEYAVLYHPNATKEQAERGEIPKSEIIVQPTMILANAEAEATIGAARAIPQEHVDHVEQLEILVRPF